MNRENSETSCTNVEVCDTKTLTEVLQELNIANTQSDNSDDNSYSNSEDSNATLTESNAQIANSNNKCLEMPLISIEEENGTKSARILTSGDENVVITNKHAMPSNTAKHSKSTKRKANQLTVSSKQMTNWGEMVGIYDSNGHMKRVVSLNELTNYLHLKRKAKSNFKFYVSLIDSRYPRVLRNVEYRWRMRYNIFVSGVIDDNSLVLHIGEIHLYFDLAKKSANPRYINCSFYGNYQPFRVVIDSARLKHMTHILKSLLTSNDLLQLKFPIGGNLFRNTNELYAKFVERQKELMQQSMFYFQNEWIPNGKWFNIAKTDDPIVKNTNDYETRRRNQPIDEKTGDNRTKSGHKRNAAKNPKRFYGRNRTEQRVAVDNSRATAIDYLPSNARYNCNLNMEQNCCECCVASDGLATYSSRVAPAYTSAYQRSNARYQSIDDCLSGQIAAQCLINQMRRERTNGRDCAASYR